MSQYGKENVEAVGTVKLDVLRLINIESLYNQVDLVKKEYGIDENATAEEAFNFFKKKC